MKNKSLIISPTGCSMFFDNSFDKDDHWRYTKQNRSYETCLVVFNDFEPEPGTYDMIIRHKGRKWAMLNEICDKIKWEDYQYIAYFDDDYCTTVTEINKALDIAKKNDFRLFQQSLTSWTVYPILTHNSNYVWTETNFIELGVPFFRNDIFRKVLRFFQDYTPGEAEWGMDKVLCFYLQASAHVIHETKIKHMRRESYYDKTKAFAEMDYLMKDWFPKYMDEKFGLKYEYSDQQFAFRALQKQYKDE
jgi:hypothetical protein